MDQLTGITWTARPASRGTSDRDAWNTHTYYQDKGVRLLAQQTVAAIEPAGQQFTVRTAAGDEVPCDAVVAGIGIEPDVALAQALGLAVDNGIVVDEYLRTSQP